MKTGQVTAGMKVLIHGISGGVGLLAAQFAQRKGAEVIGTASHESIEKLGKFKFHRLIDYKKERGF